MLDTLHFFKKRKSKSNQGVSETLIGSLKLSKKEHIYLKKHNPVLLLQSISNYFSKTGKREYQDNFLSDKIVQKLSTFKKKENIAQLYPFIQKDNLNGYNIQIVFFAYLDLLDSLLTKGNNSESINSVLENIRILYFQNHRTLGDLNTEIYEIIAQGIKYISQKSNKRNSTKEMVDIYLGSFPDESYINSDAQNHMIYFKQMLAKKPYYTSRKFIGLGLASLGIISNIAYQSIEKKETHRYKQISEEICYPWDQGYDEEKKIKFQDILEEQKKAKKEIQQNEGLYQHSPTGISITSVKDKKEYIDISTKIGDHSGHFHSHNEFHNLSTTSDIELKIDYDILKKQFYGLIFLLRGDTEYSLNDITYGFVDEIRIADLPGNVVGLFKKWTEKPTDKDVYIDKNLALHGTKIDQEKVVLHELVHSLIGTSSSVMRNEGMTESLVQRSFYRQRNIDIYNEHHAYTPHILNFILINQIYGSGYDNFEPFEIKLTYNYQNSDLKSPNTIYSSALKSLLSKHSKDIIDPIVIAFFTGGIQSITNAKGSFLCTPGTKKGFSLLSKRYKDSEFYTIEQNNSLTDEEKIRLAINYFSSNASSLSTESYTDELPGNTVDVDFKGDSVGKSETNTSGNEDLKKQSGNGEQNDTDNLGNTENDQSSDYDTKRDTDRKIDSDTHIDKTRDTSRKGFLRDLALAIQITSFEDTGREIDSNKYNWYKGEIDPMYFHERISNILHASTVYTITKKTDQEYESVTELEKQLINDIYNNHLKTYIPQLSKKFEQKMRSPEVYNKRVKENFSFYNDRHPFGLSKIGTNIIDEFIKEIDVLGLILTKNNIQKVIKELEYNNEVDGSSIISINFIDELMKKDFNEFFDKNDLKKNVPFFNTIYLSPNHTRLMLSNEYYSLLSGSSKINYKIDVTNRLISSIKEYINNKNLTVKNAIKKMVIEKNKQSVQERVSSSKFYNEAINRYIQPIKNDSSPIAKKLYDFFEYIDRNKNIVGSSTIIVLLCILLGVCYKMYNKIKASKNSIAEKYSTFNQIDPKYPLIEYINSIENRYIQPSGYKITLLIMYLSLFVVGHRYSNMDEYKMYYAQKKSIEYEKDRPYRSRTPHTYKNLLLHEKGKLSPQNIETIKESYTSIYQPSTNYVIPYSYYKSVIGTLGPIESKEKRVINHYKNALRKIKNKKIDAQLIEDTHTSIQHEIGKGQIIAPGKKGSIEGLLGILYLTFGALLSVFALSKNGIRTYKKVIQYRKKIQTLIEGGGHFSLNEKSVDLIADTFSKTSKNKELRMQLEKRIGSIGTIESDNNISELLSLAKKVEKNGKTNGSFTNKILLEENLNFNALTKIAEKELEDRGVNFDSSVQGLAVNYNRNTLLGNKYKQGTLQEYKNDPSGFTLTIINNFIEQYLPYLLVAKKRSIPLETLINYIPNTSETIYFSNVKLLKDSIQKMEKDGKKSNDSPLLMSIMIPQIKPTTLNTTIEDFKNKKIHIIGF